MLERGRGGRGRRGDRSGSRRRRSTAQQARGRGASGGGGRAGRYRAARCCTGRRATPAPEATVELSATSDGGRAADADLVRRRRRRTRGTPAATSRRETPAPRLEIDRQLGRRVRPDRRSGARAGARDPGLHRQAVPDPERLDGADARRSASACSSTGSATTSANRRSARSSSSTRPQARPNSSCGAAARITPGRRAVPEPAPKEASANYIKRVVAGPGDTIEIIEGHVILNGKRESDSYITVPRRSPSATSRRRSRFPPVTGS